MQPKILNANIACAGNPSHCKMIASFDNILHIRVLVLELPAQWFKALPLLIFAMLTHDYRECSRYSRVTVGTPELQLSNTFSNVLSLGMVSVGRLPSEF